MASAQLEVIVIVGITNDVGSVNILATGVIRTPDDPKVGSCTLSFPGSTLEQPVGASELFFVRPRISIDSVVIPDLVFRTKQQAQDWLASPAGLQWAEEVLTYALVGVKIDVDSTP